MGRIEGIVARLNSEQRRAVCETEGPLLILAGAGTGKTRVITTRIAYLIRRKLAKPSEILAVTFTNKAAQEMAGRVAEIVGRTAAQAVMLSTFHSFCLKVLRAEIERLGYRKNFSISTESDARTLVRRSVQDMDGVRESFDAAIFAEQISLIKNMGGEDGVRGGERAVAEEDKTAAKYRTWLPEIYERYQSALRAANTVDFDDLLVLTLKLWREHPGILKRYQKRFKYIMVDEYQDTNRVQYALVSALAGQHRNLCVVGDDDQSIYGWRGANARNMKSLEEDFPETKVVKLEENYRSTETILNAANAVIGHNRSRRKKALWSALGPGRAMDWIIVGDDEHEAREAARWLRYIQDKSDARYSDFVVLYRSNMQSRPFEIAFRQAKIPYLVVGGQEFYERSEIKDVVAYLKVLANPRDEASFLRIVNVPRRGVGDKTLHDVHAICREEEVSFAKGLARALDGGSLPANAERGIRGLLALLKKYRSRFREGGASLFETAGDFVHETGYRAELGRVCKTSNQFAARWANVEALLAAIGDYEKGSTGATLYGFLGESELASEDPWQDKDERRRKAVTLMTIHSAKGLEFPFVFIAGMEEGLLPHVKSSNDEGIEEERRLFYVALTRAQRHVTLFEALSRTRHGKERASKTSRFMDELPPDLVRKRFRAADNAPKAPTPKKKKTASRRRKARPNAKRG